MSECAKFQELIDQGLDESLSFPQQTALDRHLKACADCRRYQDEAQELLSCLDGALLTSLDVDLAPILVARLQAESWRRTIITLLLGVAVVVLFAVNVLSLLPPLLESPVVLTLSRVFRGPLIEAAVSIFTGLRLSLEGMPAGFWLTCGVLILLNKLVLLRIIGIPVIKGR